MVTLNYSLVGGNADTIPLTGAGGYYLRPGFRGVGIPPVEVKITASAGDGGTWRNTRRGVRTLDLPIMIIGDDRVAVENKLRRLAAALADRYGTPKLLASYSDGSSYSMEVHYTGGAETTFGSDAGATFASWPIVLQAPEPYWLSTTPIQFSLAYQAGTRGLIPRLDQLQVAPSEVLGSYVITNPGEVEAFPVWTLEGKASGGTSITRDGLGFTYTEVMVSGDKRIIDARYATVVDDAAVNKYAFLGSAPKLFAIPPGQSTIAITVPGADSSTKISGYFLPRREVLH
jgi:phage-related protein